MSRAASVFMSFYFRDLASNFGAIYTILLIMM